MDRSDWIRIAHILEAAQEAVDMLGNRTAPEFAQDRMCALAVVKCVEVIGEAAARLSPDIKGELDAFPWSAMIGMRNVLVHVYFDVDYDVVYETVRTHLPRLIQDLGALVDEKGAPPCA